MPGKTHFGRRVPSKKCIREMSKCDEKSQLAGIRTELLKLVVGDVINIMKTTFELNFDFCQAF